MIFDQFSGCRKSGERMLKAIISKSKAIWTVKRLTNRKSLLPARGPEGGPETLFAGLLSDTAAI
jgi:hypothetical protein